MLIFSALIGYKKNIYEKFEKSGEPIKFSIFENNNLQDFIYLLALIHYKKDISIFKVDSEIDICAPFEYYASGGLTVIKGWLSSFHASEPQKSIMKGLLQENFIPNDLEGISLDKIIDTLSFQNV